MKKLLLIGAAVILMASCTDVAQDENFIKINDQRSLTNFETEIDFFDIEKKMKIYEQENQQRLADKSHLKKSCDFNIRVPIDYPSIQEAVDIVCEGGNVMVSPGVYTEQVYINKSGIKIKAMGDVELRGGFALNENADGTTIQNFKIKLTYRDGIVSYKADNLIISQNEINDHAWLGRAGIILGNSIGSTILKNKINEIGVGITITAFDENNEVISKRNSILNNSISRFSGTGINLRGNVDENSIKNNAINDAFYYRVPPEGGIVLDYTIVNSILSSSDNNEIKNNYASEAISGILISDFNMGNKVSGNEFSNNLSYGIYSGVPKVNGDPNVFKNNKTLDNGLCDIVDNSRLNSHNNYTADCINIL